MFMPSFKTKPSRPPFARLANPFILFHNLLAGPPMTESDRFQGALAEARARKYPGGFNNWN